MKKPHLLDKIEFFRVYVPIYFTIVKRPFFSKKMALNIIIFPSGKWHNPTHQPLVPWFLQSGFGPQTLIYKLFIFQFMAYNFQSTLSPF